MAEMATPALRGPGGPATRHFLVVQHDRREWMQEYRQRHGWVPYHQVLEMWLNTEPVRRQQFEEAQAAYEVECSVRHFAFLMKWDGWMDRYRKTGR